MKRPESDDLERTGIESQLAANGLLATPSGPHTNDAYQRMLMTYLEVCNKVMLANRDRFPYRQIWAASEKALRGNPVILTLVTDSAKASCRVAMDKSAIKVHPLASACVPSCCQVPAVHAVAADYVEDVLSDPDRYVADPSLINWDWLKR